jgi:hypothetical protein
VIPSAADILSPSSSPPQDTPPIPSQIPPTENRQNAKPIGESTTDRNRAQQQEATQTSEQKDTESTKSLPGKIIKQHEPSPDHNPKSIAEKQTPARQPPTARQSAGPQPIYDPMFAADSQPGFKTYERKTKLSGKFSFGRRATLDVSSSPMGQYQAIVYRAIGNQWYHQCEINRDLILVGMIQVRILILPNGKIHSTREIARSGASEGQKSFTFLAIKLARIPAMPPEVRQELIGETLEMIFDFNF